MRVRHILLEALIILRNTDWFFFVLMREVSQSQVLYDFLIIDLSIVLKVLSDVDEVLLGKADAVIQGDPEEEFERNHLVFF